MRLPPTFPVMSDQNETSPVGQSACPLSAREIAFIEDDLRDWIHEQPWSECGPGADTCPDWPKAFEIRDVVIRALERAR